MKEKAKAKMKEKMPSTGKMPMGKSPGKMKKMKKPGMGMCGK